MFLLGTPGYSASGTYDPIARRGAANESVAALRFERLTAKGGRAFELRDMGIEIAGTRAYVTGRIVNVKSTIAAAKRAPHGVLRLYPGIDHFDIYDGPGHEAVIADELAFLDRYVLGGAATQWE